MYISVPSSVRTVNCTVYSSGPVYTVQCTAVYRPVYTVQCTAVYRPVYTVQCTAVYRPVYTVQCTAGVQCKLCSVPSFHHVESKLFMILRKIIYIIYKKYLNIRLIKA